LDIAGVNYYYNNQEWIKVSPKGKVTYQTISLNSQRRRTLTGILAEVNKRYHRPVVITQTGALGELRAKWWARMYQELPEVYRSGIPLLGICVYPVLDRPDWEDGRLTNSGLWDFQPHDKFNTRYPHQPSLKLLSQVNDFLSSKISLT
jgi:hypothetical protein